MINWQWVYSTIFDFLNMYQFAVVGILIQKIVFLESHTRQQMKNITKLVLWLSAVNFFVLVLLQLFPAKDFDVVPYYTVFIFVSFLFAPIIYSAYLGRKRHKWLAFVEFVPVIGCVDGTWALIDLVKSFIPSHLGQQVFDTIVLLAIIAAVAILIWRRPRWVNTLIKDIRKRSLTRKEELVVWIVGSWLFVYDIFIKDSISVYTSEFVMGYINVLNFVSAAVVIAYVINSNYRDYYFKRNMQLQRSLINTVAELIENRDENTGGHIQRTSQYVEIIARKLQQEGKYSDILTDKYIEQMVIAAPLHDVGKIHIPDAILNKPGKLDAEEFATMKTHSAAGGAIIAHIEENAGEMEYLKIAKEMAEYHHERMDGKGYPHGLSGDDIPLCARILAVADVFDAVSSKRCYKEAFSLDKSFAIIEEEAGSHFDMEVAQAFLSCRGEVEAMFA